MNMKPINYRNRIYNTILLYQFEPAYYFASNDGAFSALYGFMQVLGPLDKWKKNAMQAPYSQGNIVNKKFAFDFDAEWIKQQCEFALKILDLELAFEEQ